MLETVDLSAQLDRAAFQQQKDTLRNEVRRAQLLAWKHKIGVIVVLEGWSYAGRASCARFLAEGMDPRGLRTHVFYPPTKDDKRYPFHRRYWAELPARGDVAVFVRSWYSHLMEGQVQQRSPALSFSEVVDEVRELESVLEADRYLIVKFFLHIDAKTERKRRRKFSHGRARLTRALPDDPRQHKRRKRYTEAIEAMLAATDTDAGRWFLIPANSERFAIQAVATTLVRRIDEEVARRPLTPATGKPAPVAEPLALGTSVLRSLDMTQKLEDEAYSDRLLKAQWQLGELLYSCVDQRRAVVLAFEGWDAGGKGGAIRRLTAELDPRYYIVHPIAAPNTEEKARHYLWRFWRRVPEAGHWAVFDRTWYGRVLVERVEGFATEAEWRRAYDEIRHFERTLIEHGAIVLKFWLHITLDEQLRRFQERQEVEYKNFKITDDDWRNREKWDQYEPAVEEMVQRTSMPLAPWVVVPANDKNFARITILETVQHHVEQGLARKQSRLRRRF